MPGNSKPNRSISITDLISVESMGSAFFLFIVGCLCILVIIAGLSRVHSQTDDLFGIKRRAQATRLQEPQTDICGVPPQELPSPVGPVSR